MSIAGVIAAVLGLTGAVCLGNKWRVAFLFTLAVEAIWCGIGIRTGQYDLSFVCGLACFMALRNFRKWGLK